MRKPVFGYPPVEAALGPDRVALAVQQIDLSRMNTMKNVK